MKLNEATNEIFYDLLFAKIKAMENQTYIRVCFDKEININNQNIKSDYLIAEAKIGSTDCTFNNLKKILLQKNITRYGININKQINVSNITFDPNGFIIGINNTTLKFTTKPPGDKTLVKEIKINRFGRITVGDIYEQN